MATMTLEEFAEATLDVLREDGIAAYLPTVCLPARREIQVVEGIPATVPDTEAIKHVAAMPALAGQRLLLGVRSGPSRVDVVEVQPGRAPRFLSILEDDDGALVVARGEPEAYGWWTGDDDVPVDA